MAKKHSGRPPKFTADTLKSAIIGYFKKCVRERLIPNKAGLRANLDISRETYSEYRKKFPDTIKIAENLIEEAWVQRLTSNAPTGAIFYLKNAFKEDYKDRYATDVTSGGKPIPLYDFTVRHHQHGQKNTETEPED